MPINTTKQNLDILISSAKIDDADTFKTTLEQLLLHNGVLATSELLCDKLRNDEYVIDTVLCHSAIACFDVLMGYQCAQFNAHSPNALSGIFLNNDIPDRQKITFLERNFATLVRQSVNKEWVFKYLFKLVPSDTIKAWCKNADFDKFESKIIFNNAVSHIDTVTVDDILSWCRVFGKPVESILLDKELRRTVFARGKSNEQINRDAFLEMIESYDLINYPMEDHEDFIGKELSWSFFEKGKPNFKAEFSEETLIYNLKFWTIEQKKDGSENILKLIKALLENWFSSHYIAIKDIPEWWDTVAIDDGQTAKMISAGLMLDEYLKSDVNEHEVLESLYAFSPTTVKRYLESQNSELNKAKINKALDFVLKKDGASFVSSTYASQIFKSVLFTLNKQKDVLHGDNIDFMMDIIRRVDIHALDFVKSRLIFDADDVNQWKMYLDHRLANTKMLKINNFDFELGFYLLLMINKFGLNLVLSKCRKDKMLECLLFMYSPFDILSALAPYQNRERAYIMKRLA